MNTKVYTLVVGLAAAGLIACGGDPEPSIECADGTEFDEEAGECLLERTECDDGEQYVEELDACARVQDEYCGEDTDYDEDQQACVAEEVDCGENTKVEDDECIPQIEIECGAGTVVYDGHCVPSEDVCAEDTEDVSGDDAGVSCRPMDSVCGEGATLDVIDQVCVPISDVECGPGTVVEDLEGESVCVPLAEVAENPDLDTTDTDGIAEIDVPEQTGERFVFVGNIDEPIVEDGSESQQMDVYEFDAEMGDWLEVTVYSLGLPEPGFEVSGGDEFYRLSDVGTGLEAKRQIVVPADGQYQLAVSNLPQMLGELSPAGGDDFGYVGYVERRERPKAEPVDIFDEPLEGDIQQVRDGLYRLEEMGDVESIQMLLQLLPEDADAELQIWEDETTLHEVAALDEASLGVIPPADSFELLFDYEHAAGSNTSYHAEAREGVPLQAGESVDEQFDLQAGDYIGVSQYNTDGEPIEAKFRDEDDQIIGHTGDLVVSIAEQGQRYLYMHAHEEMSVTLELENNTGSDLDSVSYDTVEGVADEVEFDGDDEEIDYDATLLSGQRHYLELDSPDYDELVALTVQDTGADTRVVVLDEDGQEVATAANTVIYQAGESYHLVYVEAVDAIDGGFSLSIEESTIFELSETSSPGTSIPTGGDATDTIDIDNCPTVTEIDMDVEIFHNWRGDLEVRLENPAGDEILLKDASGSANDIIGNFNDTLDPEGSGAEPISEFEDDLGTGTWTLTVDDTVGWEPPGTLSEWTLNLTCEG